MVCTVMSQRQLALFMWLLVYNDVKPVQMHNVDRNVGPLATVWTIGHSHLKDNGQCYEIKRKISEKVLPSL